MVLSIDHGMGSKIAHYPPLFCTHTRISHSWLECVGWLICKNILRENLCTKAKWLVNEKEEELDFM